MPQIVVIGGGIIGVSTAWRLAQAGAEVTLLEARELASGTSSASFAWMNSNNKAPLEYHRLNVSGMDEHLALHEEFGEASWLFPSGNVIWDSRSQQPGISEPDVPVRGESIEAKVRRLQSWNYPLEVRSRRDVSESHPEIAIPEDVDQVLYFPTEGYVDVPFLVAHLAREAKRLGARIDERTEVVEILRESGRIIGVVTSRGDRFYADTIISCAGRWTDHATALLGGQSSVPMAPTLGMLVTTSKVPSTLRSLVHTPLVNLRPDGGSRFLLASFEVDDRLRDDLTDTERNELARLVLDRAKQVLPVLEDATVATQVIGVRSIPADGYPAVGFLPGVEGFYIVATHSGVTMGPVLGRIVSREILEQFREPMLDSFRPDRFRVAST